MTPLHVRDAAAEDLELLTQLLVDCVAWQTGSAVGRDDVLADPRLARFLEGWPLCDDAGVVGEADGPVGAAWYRRVRPADEGFVSAAIPVVTLAVRPDRRRRGHGAALLGGLTQRARRQGVQALSLAVSAESLHTFRRLGFVQVGAHDSGVTMLLELAP